MNETEKHSTFDQRQMEQKIDELHKLVTELKSPIQDVGALLFILFEKSKTRNSEVFQFQSNHWVVAKGEYETGDLHLYVYTDEQAAKNHKAIDLQPSQNRLMHILVNVNDLANDSPTDIKVFRSEAGQNEEHHINGQQKPMNRSGQGMTDFLVGAVGKRDEITEGVYPDDTSNIKVLLSDIAHAYHAHDKQWISEWIDRTSREADAFFRDRQPKGIVATFKKMFLGKSNSA